MRRFLSFVFVLLGCHADSPLVPVDVRAWAEARARWQAAGISHYRYESGLSCFCPAEIAGPITVEYRDGILVDARYASGAPVPATLAQSRPPIDSLFAVILEQNDQWTDKVEVTYDARYGYPRVINVFAKPGIADGGSTRTITRFDPLP